MKFKKTQSLIRQKIKNYGGKIMKELKEKLTKEVYRFFLKNDSEKEKELQSLLENFYKLNKLEDRVEVLITAFEALIEERGLYDFSKQIKKADDDFGIIFKRCDKIEDFISTHLFLLKQICK